MTLAGWAQLVALVVLLAVTAPPLGRFIAHVYEGGPSRLDRVFGPVERLIYRTCRIDADREQRWNVYAISMLAFSVVGFFLLYLIQRIQSGLPFNPTDMTNVAPALSFNTAVSFMTNTNWQNYGGENTLSHLTQMFGLTVQNFVSAAAGMAVMVALIGGLARAGQRTIGNFWVDLVRTTLRILLPISFVFAVVLLACGVIQNTNGFKEVHTVAGTTQAIPGGPVASQISIKQLGTNGGGFFNTNSAHPFENPTQLSDFFELYAITLVPFALAFTFGRMVKNKRQGYAVVSIMGVLFLGAAIALPIIESGGNPKLDTGGVTQAVTKDSPGGNMEGKEVRFGPAASGLWGANTTGTSNGSVNSMHDSYTPLGGTVALVNMKLGEISPGGVGVGLNGLLFLAILSVFIAGLMVGRTPEYLGKKIQAAEVKLVAIYILVMPALVMLFVAGSTFVQSVLNVSIYNPGAHGFSELLYTFTSAANNNGSAFAGLTGNTPWMNTTLGLAMLFGRFFLIIPTLALAGSVVRKRRVPTTAGTFPTDTPLFVTLVVGVAVIVAALAFLPALALGPIVEQLENLIEELHPMPGESKLVEPEIVQRAVVDSFVKLNPRTLARNPVMFVVGVGSVLTTVLFFKDLGSSSTNENVFTGLVALFLWFTVLFANFAEAIAEGRGKAQADTLRKTRSETVAHVTYHDGRIEDRPSTSLDLGDLCVVSAGEVIPSDGEVIEGIASVDESAITGESAPVIRESGGDRSAVTGGTRVLSDQIVVRITARAGETFIDRMIALVEGSKRQKTPNEIALNILLAGLTIIFLLATVSLQPFAMFANAEQPVVILVALLVCLIPTTIGALLSAIGIAGMDRLVRRNVSAMSGRAVEAAGDCATLLLDKTGTITFGNRQADAFIPVNGVTEQELADAAQLSSLADETPEGRSIVVLAKERYGLRERELVGAELVAFTAQTRMSGVDFENRSVRKDAADSVRRWVEDQGGTVPDELGEAVDSISAQGGTPLVVAEAGGAEGTPRPPRALGVIYLKDIVKPGIAERFADLRRMGIRTVMITGDNPRTAAVIAREAGVDDFLAEATPEDKMQLIKDEQRGGRLVAMTGDGTNDAPTLAQADVGVAMNTGTQAAKEAGNMVDLDSDPTKLIDIVEIGKQLLITRGSLTTFSIANDVAKYFAIIPTMFAGFASVSVLNDLNVMDLQSPRSAILSAVIFNAIIIVMLIPLAFRGVKFIPTSAAHLLRRNLLIYGAGGVVAPFIGIKLIDIIITALGVK